MLGSTNICFYDLARTTVLIFTSQFGNRLEWLKSVLLKNVRYLLSNASLDKSFWAETLVYTSHLMNRLSSTAIGEKTLLDIWLGGATHDYSLLECLA